MAFGYLFEPGMLEHTTGNVTVALPDGTLLPIGPHPSSEAITAAIDRLLVSCGFADRCTRLAPRAATPEDLRLVHTAAYVDRVRALSAAGGGEAGDVAPVGPRSYQAACIAAGSAMAAVDAVLDGAVQAAYVLTRPPGHHALPDLGMGYCLFNNAALAARHARRRGCGRVLLLDWDVHHGNGSQAVFYQDSTVLFVSLHQERWYPRDQGTLAETGNGPGHGATINIPLPPGTGDRGYREAIDTIVRPAALRFKPDLVVLSAGQDAAMLDPLGRMLVSAAGFKALGASVKALAAELCEHRLVAVQEGGYSLPYTPMCTLKALEGLAGLDTQVVDPYVDSTEQAYAESVYLDGTRRALEEARRAQQTAQ